jgi:hypothetical protein
MSKIALSPDDSGTGTFTLASPNSNTNRTLTLPDAAGELLTTTGDGSGLTGVNSFKPVAVTGTTPSLNVGTYNYFDNGTLSADTTVTFASVPTDARWTYSFTPSLIGSAWDISAAVPDGGVSTTTNDTQPRGLFFKPDGLKMYVAGSTDDAIDEYDLSTAWDVTTATYLQTYSIAGQETSVIGLFFKPDGTKMYISGISGVGVDEYSLSTAWDVSTASFVRFKSVSSQETNPRNIFFKADGLKMYMAGTVGGDITEFNLSTAWNISTLSAVQTFSVAAQGPNPSDVFFKDDGLKMYVNLNPAKTVLEYDLSTAWDISTAVYLQSFLHSYISYAIFFKPDGLKMFVQQNDTDGVEQYTLGSVSTMTLPAAVVGTPSASTVGNRVTYEFVTLDGGTTVNLIAEESIAP